MRLTTFEDALTWLVDVKNERKPRLFYGILKGRNHVCLKGERRDETSSRSGFEGGAGVFTGVNASETRAPNWRGG